MSGPGSSFRTSGDDNALIWQTRNRTGEIQYGLTTHYTRLHDRLGLVDRLSEENDLFGVRTYDLDGVVVSRDLLDSIAELTFLDDELGIGSRPITVMDIGAGYGRLAHRGTTAFDELRFVCVDAVPLSTFLCEYYLAFRGVSDRARTIPLDEVASSADVRCVDVAVNIHSFPSVRMSVIECGSISLARNRVRHLMIVPNTRDASVNERSGRRIDFWPAIEARGFELVRKRRKYADSDFVQKHGIFPAEFFLFRRRG